MEGYVRCEVRAAERRKPRYGRQIHGSRGAAAFIHEFRVHQTRQQNKSHWPQQRVLHEHEKVVGREWFANFHLSPLTVEKLIIREA